MPVEVLCIGHAAYDFSLFVDDFPLENSKTETPDLLQTGGGPAANAA
jgi:sulfofructose kinase